MREIVLTLILLPPSHHIDGLCRDSLGTTCSTTLYGSGWGDWRRVCVLRSVGRHGENGSKRGGKGEEGDGGAGRRGPGNGMWTKRDDADPGVWTRNITSSAWSLGIPSHFAIDLLRLRLHRSYRYPLEGERDPVFCLGETLLNHIP